MLNVNQRSCEYQLFKSFGFLDEGIERRFTDYEANAITTRPLAGMKINLFIRYNK